MEQIGRDPRRYGFMDSGQATKQAFEVVPSPNGDAQTLLDSHGSKVEVKRGLMARIDDKGAESVTLRKSTLWFAGTALVLFQVLFNYGGSVIGWARDDQTQKEQSATMKSQIDETRNDVKDLKNQFTELQKVLQVQALQEARGEGYKLGVVDAHNAPKK